MNLNFDEFKNSDYDKERTFDFLQKVIAEKTPDWKEIVLNPKIFISLIRICQNIVKLQLLI